eukprot:c19341_g1_i1 orf=153-1271(+)
MAACFGSRCFWFKILQAEELKNMASSSWASCCTLLILGFCIGGGSSFQYLNPPLRVDFYAQSCPQFSKIVEDRVAYYSSLDGTTPAPLLRLFFHDCFVQGCDGSVLINSTTKNSAEKDADINFSIGNFFVLDDIKRKLEEECPNTVSCADVIALTAVYSIKQAGGPLYQIELGRRDALTSYAPSAETLLPAFNLTVNGLLENLANVGLDETDLVALSGAHTIGQGHCESIVNRIGPHVDGQYHKGYQQQLLANCTDDGSLRYPNYDNNTQFFNDPITPLVFDNQYYKNLKLGYGLFTSDVSLYNDPRTRNLVDLYAKNQSAFFHQFGISLQKMGTIGILTGTQGQIRKQCWVRNSNNADYAFNPDSLQFTDS